MRSPSPSPPLPGLRVSHELSTAQILPPSAVAAAFDPAAQALAAERADVESKSSGAGAHVAKPTALAAAAREASLVGAVESVLARLAETSALPGGASYSLFGYTGAADAETVFVAIGAGAVVVSEAVKKAGAKVGVVHVNLYRPWAHQQFLDTIPTTARRIVVLERAEDPTSTGEPLYLDVLSTVSSSLPAHWASSSSPAVVGGTYGLGTEDFTPASVLQIIDAAASPRRIPRRFSVNALAASNAAASPAAASAISAAPSLDASVVQGVVWGVGNDGAAGVVTNTLQLLGGGDGGCFVQGYHVYDSSDRGLVTSAHMRVAPGTTAPIRAPYMIERGAADFVLCLAEELFDVASPLLRQGNGYDVVDALRPGGALVLNVAAVPGAAAAASTSDLARRLPSWLKTTLVEKRIRLLTIDGTAVANKFGLCGRNDAIFQAVLLHLIQDIESGAEAIDVDAAHTALQSSLATSVGKYFHSDVSARRAAADATAAAVRGLVPVVYPASQWTAAAAGEGERARPQPQWPASLDHLLVPVVVETTYTRLLRRLFGGDAVRIANEDGNLFEDNATYGYGVHVATSHERARLVEDVESVVAALSSCPSPGLASEVGSLRRRIRKALTEWVDGHNDLEASRRLGTAVTDILADVDEGAIKGEGAGSGAGKLWISKQDYDESRLHLVRQVLDVPRVRECLESVRARTHLLSKQSQWIVGGDGWTHDISYKGIDAVLRSGRNVNILLLETQSATGGADGPLTRATLPATWERKRTMGLYGMKFSDAYVASSVFGSTADLQEQLETALVEAEQFDGPSLVVAYCPEQSTQAAMRDVVDQGLWPLYRWRPTVASSSSSSSSSSAQQQPRRLSGETKHSVESKLGREEQEREDKYTAAREQQGVSPPRGEFIIDSDSARQALAEFVRHDANQAFAFQPLKELPSAERSGAGSLEDQVARAQAKGQKNSHSSMSHQSLLESFAKLSGGILGNVGGAGDGGETKVQEPLVILYGSDGGGAAEVAKSIERDAKDRGVPVQCLPADKFAGEIGEGGKLRGEAGTGMPLLLFVVSTAGQGDFPGNSEHFWHALKDAGAGLQLPSTRFGVFALGDRNYWPRPEEKVYFCKPGMDMDRALADTHGAQRLLPVGLGDDQDEDGYETALDAWLPQFWAAALGGGVGGGAAKAKKKKMTGEDVKLVSNFLRGTLAAGIADTSTAGLPNATDTLVIKHHGCYQQDDREQRIAREAAGQEKAYSFLIRIGAPGGVVTKDQYLAMDELTEEDGINDCLKLTTRQAFQFHGVMKTVLKSTIQRINKACLSTLAACGDVNRNITCNPLPHEGHIHKEVDDMARAVNAHLMPQTTAYHEIWLDKKTATPNFKDVEPLYGRAGDKPGECQYLPRKWKIAVCIPPNNDVDVFASCLGFIAITEPVPGYETKEAKGSGESKVDGSGAGATRLVGYNITVGGGMGMSHNNKKTYPRVADIIGFCTPDQCVPVAEAAMTVQRDYGDRVERKHARFKYTVEDMTIKGVRQEMEKRMGFKLQPARGYNLTDNSDRFGWIRDHDGVHWHYGLYVEHGRIVDREGYQLKTALREIAHAGAGDFRLTANQSLIVGSIKPADKPRIVQILRDYGIGNDSHTGLRLNSMACVALPTCGLALAESQRYLPTLVDALDEVVEDCGLREDAISIRMTGCPNGCARPALGEIGLIGRAAGIYNLYLGASRTGDRLNKMWKESLNHDQIVEALGPVIRRYAAERQEGEAFGDFTCRVGIIEPNLSIPKLDFSDGELRESGMTFHQHTPTW